MLFFTVEKLRESGELFIGKTYLYSLYVRLISTHLKHSRMCVRVVPYYWRCDIRQSSDCQKIMTPCQLRLKIKYLNIEQLRNLDGFHMTQQKRLKELQVSFNIENIFLILNVCDKNVSVKALAEIWKEQT